MYNAGGQEERKSPELEIQDANSPQPVRGPTTHYSFGRLY